MNTIKYVRRAYKADMRFCHPVTLKLLNTSNPNNKRHFKMRKMLDTVKSNSERLTKIKSHKIMFPKKKKYIIIDDSKYSINEIENNLFKETNIITPITLKYKVWLAVKFAEKL